MLRKCRGVGIYGVYGVPVLLGAYHNSSTNVVAGAGHIRNLVDNCLFLSEMEGVCGAKGEEWVKAGEDAQGCQDSAN